MKVSLIRSAILASMLVALAPAPGALAQQLAPLDGRVFVGEAGLKGKTEVEEKGDIITFKDGNFHSSSCDQYGYTKAPYKATTLGDATRFEAETRSEKDGRIVWKGTVQGGKIEGTFVHYRKGWLLNPNPDPIEHWFRGQAKG